MAQRRFIPETPEQIDAAWLNEVLGCEGADEIQAVSQSVLGAGEGFVGDILRLGVSRAGSSNAPSSMIVKLPKLQNRWMGELLGAYERENLFYEQFAATLPIRVPKLYYADFDRDRASEQQQEILRRADGLPRFLNGVTTRLGRWIAGNKKRRYILVIEDMVEVAPGDQLTGADTARCARVLQAVARMHAQYWNQTEALNAFWLLPMDIDARMRHSMMVEARSGFEQLYPESASRLAEHLDDLASNGLDYLRQLSSGASTLLHYDLRLDNLMFSERELAFIDWQLVRKGAPAYDVAYFLTSANNSLESSADLLAIYHAALQAEGVLDYSLEQLHTDFKLALRCVLMSLSTIDQVSVENERGANMLEVWIERLATRLEVDG